MRYQVKLIQWQGRQRIAVIDDTISHGPCGPFPVFLPPGTTPTDAQDAHCFAALANLGFPVNDCLMLVI